MLRNHWHRWAACTGVLRPCEMKDYFCLKCVWLRIDNSNNSKNNTSKNDINDINDVHSHLNFNQWFVQWFQAILYCFSFHFLVSNHQKIFAELKLKLKLIDKSVRQLAINMQRKQQQQWQQPRAVCMYHFAKIIQSQPYIIVIIITHDPTGLRSN